MVKQIAIFIENQKGYLRKVTETLHQNGITVCALSTIDSPEFGILRMILDQPEKGREVLENNFFVAKICEVIAVEMSEQKEMDELLAVVHEGNININYIYSSFGSNGHNPVMILHAADMDETEDMLISRGFHCLNSLNE